MKLYSAKEFAKRINKSGPTLSRWIREKRVVASATFGQRRAFTEQDVLNVLEELKRYDRPSVKEPKKEEPHRDFCIA